MKEVHHIIIIMPFMTNGSLLSYLKKRKNELVVPSGSEQEVSVHHIRMDDEHKIFVG